MAAPPVCSLRRLGWQYEENMATFKKSNIVRAGAAIRVNNICYDDKSI